MAIDAWRLSLHRRAWRAWQEACRQAASKREAARRAATLWRHHQAAACWRAWVAALRASNHKVNITALRPLSLCLAGRLQHQVAAAAFHCWRSRAAEQLSRLEKLSRAGSHWWHSRCSAALASWQERAIHARQKQAALLHAALAFKAGKLLPAFAAWKEHAAWRLHSKMVVARGLQVR